MLSWKDYLAAIGLLILARLAFFTEPFGISVDESTYAAIAEVLQNGGKLYVDALDRKPPGLFWLYAGVGKLFGPWNLHILHILVGLLTLGLARLAASSAETRWSFWLYILFSSALLRGILAANAEYWMLMFLAPASYLAIECFRGKFSRKSRAWILSLATLLAAISCLFKQYGGFIYAVIYLVGFSRLLAEKWEEEIKTQALAALGSSFALIVVFGSVSFYFWQNSNLENFLYYFAFESAGYMGQNAADLNQQTSNFWIFTSLIISWFPLWFLAIYVWRSQSDRRWLRLWTVGVFASLATAFFSGRHYTHYFIPVIWYLSVLGGPALETVLSKLRLSYRRWALVVIALPFLCFALINFQQELFSDHWTFTKKRQFEMESLGTWIQNNSEPEDRISVWGMASQIYSFSERGSGTAYIFADFASGRLPGFKSAESIPLPGAMQDYIDQLREKRPKFFVDTSSANLNDYGHFPLSRFPDLLEFLESYYELKLNFMGYNVYERKNDNS